MRVSGGCIVVAVVVVMGVGVGAGRMSGERRALIGAPTCLPPSRVDDSYHEACNRFPAAAQISVNLTCHGQILLRR